MPNSGAYEKLSNNGQPSLEVTDGYIRYGNQAVTPNISDEGLMQAFIRFRAEGLLPWFFPERTDVGIYEFLTTFRNPTSNTLGAFHQDEEEGSRWILDGILWTKQIVLIGGGHSVADVGQAFYRGQSDLDFYVRYAHLGIEWCLQKLHVSTVTGNTPDKNRAAVLFARKCGFEVVGPVGGTACWEGELCGTYLSAMTKSRWEFIRPWR